MYHNQPTLFGGPAGSLQLYAHVQSWSPTPTFSSAFWFEKNNFDSIHARKSIRVDSFRNLGQHSPTLTAVLQV